MDQEMFRKTYEEINERVCAYEKAMLAGYCGCSLATKVYLAEREGAQCRSDSAQAECMELLELLRHQSRFTLKTNPDSGVLPHNKVMRIQVGGLRGIQHALYPDASAEATVDDVHRTIGQAREAFGELEELPFQEIIKQIAAFKPRERRSRQ